MLGVKYMRSSHLRNVLVEAGLLFRWSEKIEPVTNETKKVTLQSVQIETFLEHLRWALVSSSSAVCEKSWAWLPLELTRGMLQAPPEWADEPVGEGADVTRLMYERHLRGVKKTLGLNDKLIIPVFGSSPQHYTLLVLDKSGSELEIRYYDSLNKMHKECLSNAKKFTQLLGLEKAFPKRRRNESRQFLSQCGWHVLHHATAEVRHLMGEGWGTVTWPNMRAIDEITDRLSDLTCSLELERVKWLQFVQQVDEKRRKVSEDRTYYY